MKSNNKWREELRAIYSKESEIHLEEEWLIVQSKMKKKKKRPIFLLIIISIGSALYYLSNLNPLPSRCPITAPFTNQSSANADIRPENSISSTVNSTANIKKDYPIFENTNVNEEKTEIILFSRPVSIKVDNNSPIYVENSNQISTKKESNLLHEAFENQRSLINHFSIDQIGINKIESKKLLDLNLSLIKPNKNKFIYWISFDMGLGRHHLNLIKTNKDKTLNSSILPKSLTSYNIRIGNNINKNSYVFAGINYLSAKEQITYRERYQKEVVLENQIIETYTNSAGLVETKYGNRNIVQLIEKTSIQKNKMAMSSLQLGIGKSIECYSFKLNADINIGLPIYTNYKGFVDNGNLEESTNQIKFGKIIYGLNAGISKSLSEKSDLTFSYSISRNQTEFTDTYKRNNLFQSFNFGITQKL